MKTSSEFLKVNKSKLYKLLFFFVLIAIHDITNTIFTSKTYILSKEECDKAWLVDIGDVEPVLEYLNVKKLTVERVFLTHAHFDHIYGLEALVDHFPNCMVYVTEYYKQALTSDKLNLSKYHGTPINYKKDNVIVMHEGENVVLYEDEPQMTFYETPGHNPGCLTMVLGDVVFTGDAYIPGVGANTKLPNSDKRQARVSLERITNLAKGKRILAGHYIE